MSKPQTGLEQPKLTFIQKCKTMRGQQMICTVTFLIAPLLLLFTFTYLPFFKMFHFSFYDRDYLRVRDFVGLRNYMDVGHAAMAGGFIRQDKVAGLGNYPRDAIRNLFLKAMESL